MSLAQPAPKPQRVLEDLVSIDVLQELVRLLTHRLARAARGEAHEGCWTALHALCSCSRFARAHLATNAVRRTLLLAAKPSAGLHCLVTAAADGPDPFTDAALRLVAERQLAKALHIIAACSRGTRRFCAGHCCMSARVDVSAALHRHEASVGANLARLLGQPPPPAPRLLALHSHAVLVGLVPARDMFWAIELARAPDGGLHTRCVLVREGRVVATSDGVALPQPMNAALVGPLAHSTYVCHGSVHSPSNFSARRWQPWSDDIEALNAGETPTATEYLRICPLPSEPVPACAVLVSHGVILFRVADGRLRCSARWTEGSSNGGLKVVIGVAPVDARHVFVLYDHEGVFTASPPQYSACVVRNDAPWEAPPADGASHARAALPTAPLVGRNVAWGKSTAIGLCTFNDTDELVLLLLARGTLRASRCPRRHCRQWTRNFWTFVPGAAELFTEDAKPPGVSVHHGATERGAAVMILDRVSHAATVVAVTSDGVVCTNRLLLLSSPAPADPCGFKSDFYPSAVDFGPSGSNPTALACPKDAASGNALLLYRGDARARARFDFKGLNAQVCAPQKFCRVTKAPLAREYDVFADSALGGELSAATRARRRDAVGVLMHAYVAGIESIDSFPGRSGAGMLVQLRGQMGAFVQVVGNCLYTPLERAAGAPAPRLSACTRAVVGVAE